MTRAILAAALMGPLCGNAVAQAPQQVCGPRDVVVAGLLRKYDESIVGHGISMLGQMMEIFASEKGSWTVLMTPPAGPSCIVSAGQSWEAFAPPLPGKGA